jgi:DNA-binding MarR family transcriptional regulator
MVENGYLIQERSVHDKRSIRVRLSEKGTKLKSLITEMFKRHEEKIKGTQLTDERLKAVNDTMLLMERFWAAQSNFAGYTPADDDE